MKRSSRAPIGIFDSGVGGVTVLKEIERLLPHEDLIYFGDTARVPYGNKSEATIIKFSTQSLLFLLKKKVKLVVVACNTSSSLALTYLQSVFSIPIIGVIEAGVRKAVRISKKKKIGVIGTRSTINSNSYTRAIVSLDKKAKVYSQACPLFVPLAEEGIVRGKVVRDVMRMYLREIKRKNVDVIILGCTHYPLLKHEIAHYLNDIYIVDSAREVALHTKEIIEHLNMRNPGEYVGKRYFYVTDEPKGFINVAKLFLRQKIQLPEIVNII